MSRLNVMFTFFFLPRPYAGPAVAAFRVAAGNSHMDDTVWKSLELLSI